MRTKPLDKKDEDIQAFAETIIERNSREINGGFCRILNKKGTHFNPKKATEYYKTYQTEIEERITQMSKTPTVVAPQPIETPAQPTEAMPVTPERPKLYPDATDLGLTNGNIVEKVREVQTIWPKVYKGDKGKTKAAPLQDTYYERLLILCQNIINVWLTWVKLNENKQPILDEDGRPMLYSPHEHSCVWKTIELINKEKTLKYLNEVQKILDPMPLNPKFPSVKLYNNIVAGLRMTDVWAKLPLKEDGTKTLTHKQAFRIAEAIKHTQTTEQVHAIAAAIVKAEAKKKLTKAQFKDLVKLTSEKSKVTNKPKDGEELTEAPMLTSLKTWDATIFASDELLLWANKASDTEREELKMLVKGALKDQIKQIIRTFRDLEYKCRLKEQELEEPLQLE